MEKRIYRHPRKRMALLLFVTMIPFAALTLPALAPEVAGYRVLAILLTVETLLLAGLIVREFFWPQLFALMDAEGISMYYGRRQTWEIPWSQIARLHLSQPGMFQLVKIELSDVQAFVRHQNPINRLALRLNEVFFGSPIILIPFFLPIPVSELESGFEMYRKGR